MCYNSDAFGYKFIELTLENLREGRALQIGWVFWVMKWVFKNSSGWCFPSFPKWTKSHKESVPHFLFFSRSPHTPFIHPTSYFMRGSIPGGYYLRRRFNLFYLPEENIWNILMFLWSARISCTTPDVSPTPIMTKCQLLKEISELFLQKND